jgi:hypothetical protein
MHRHRDDQQGSHTKRIDDSRLRIKLDYAMHGIFPVASGAYLDETNKYSMQNRQTQAARTSLPRGFSGKIIAAR